MRIFSSSIVTDWFGFTVWIEWLNDFSDLFFWRTFSFLQKRKTNAHAFVCFEYGEIMLRCALYFVPLCVAFSDLKTAFDSTHWEKLWGKLAASTVDCFTSKLIRFFKYVQHIITHFEGNSNGDLIGPFPTYKGVKEGHMLALLLFKLYINDIVEVFCQSGLCTSIFLRIVPNIFFYMKMM